MTGTVKGPATYYPDDVLSQQYGLAKTLRNQPSASSWAGVLAQGLGALGGNIVQGSANGAVMGNQAMRSADMAAAGGAGSVGEMNAKLLASQVPELQSAGLQGKMKALSDDPHKTYRIRAEQALQNGMNRNSPEFRQFVLTGQLQDPLDTQYKQAQIAKLQREPAGGEAPSNVREWQYYQTLPPEDQAKYLTMKRAEKYLNTGTEFVRPNPVVPGENISSVPINNAETERQKTAGRAMTKGAIGLPKAKAAIEQYELQSDTVIEDIDRAMKLADGFAATGIGGAITSNIPGTPGYNLNELLYGIKANLGFDKLQNMRDNSPTGGALGQVSEFENKLLQSVWGSIAQSQNKEQFIYNLSRIKGILQKFKVLKRDAYEKDVARFGAENVPDPSSGLLPTQGDHGTALDEARAAIESGADRESVIERLIENGIDPGDL